MTPNATPTPANRLYDLRTAAEESRVELAYALGFKSHKQIERWESGEEIPTVRARAIALRYGVSISYLLCDENGPEPEKAAA